jgi:GAF domain-containing protein
VRSRNSSAAREETKVARLTRERDAALQQQRATADVLKVISRSAFNLQAVLNALTESAVRLCAADLGLIFQQDGGVLRLIANFGVSREAERYWLEHPVPVGRGSASGRALLEGRAIHIPDVLADPEYRATRYQELAGYRSTLGVPLLRDGTTIGVFGLGRREPHPFTEKQIELVTTFADQAVIAIENVRLFDDVQARSREVKESLEYQTAMSDVLNVISRSPNVLQSVLDTIVQTAARLCEAEFSVFFRLREGLCHIAASNAEADFIKFAREHPFIPTRASCSGRAVLERRTVHVLDASTDPEYAMPDYQLVANNRTMLAVPLLRDGTPLGTITLWKTRVEPFTEKQINLITTFADQALIAIENVRLFEAEQQRTRELSESLEQQTATSEVLKVISGSPGELEPVFKVMLENAVRICGAKFGTLALSEGDAFRTVALHGAPPPYAEVRRREPVIRFGPGTATSCATKTKQPVQIADIQAEPAYANDPQRSAILELAGARTMLAVPMLKEDEVVGVIWIYRQEVQPFTDKQIALVQNFAAQAVIAIENARLLSELRQRTDDLTESLEQQTATSDVLRVISSSPADIQPVLETIGERAEKLCDAEISVVSIVDGEVIRVASIHGMTEAGVEASRRAFPQQRTDESVTARAIRTRNVCHVADVLSDPQY